MATRRRSVSRGTTPRRKRVWVRRSISEATLAVGAEAHSLVLSGFETSYGAQLIGSTVARVRLDMFVQKATASYGATGLLWGLRIATVDQVDDLTAPTAGYGPGSRPYADWMAYGLLQSSGNTPGVESMDVKSMRKLDELNQTLVLSVENASADILEWGGQLSVLMLLP